MHLPSSLSAHASTLVLATMLAGSLGLGCPGPEPQVMEGAGGEDASTATGPSSTTGLPASSSGSSAGSTKVSSGVGGNGGDGGEGGAGGKGGDGGENQVGTTTGAGGCDDLQNDPLNCGECGYACSMDGLREADGAFACKEGTCKPTCRIGRLDLVQHDLDTPDDGCETVASRVFVTAQTVVSNLGQLADYDDFCANAAKVGALETEGEWLAWIGDMEDSVAMRFMPTVTPYVTLDNTIIAYNWLDLLDGELLAPINLDQNLDDITVVDPELGARLVRTGTLGGGATSPDRCLEWTTGSEEELGTVGLVMTDAEVDGMDSTAWTNFRAEPCNTLARLYCFEQP